MVHGLHSLFHKVNHETSFSLGRKKAHLAPDTPRGGELTAYALSKPGKARAAEQSASVRPLALLSNGRWWAVGKRYRA